MPGTPTPTESWRRDPAAGWIALGGLGALAASAFVALAIVELAVPAVGRFDAMLSAVVRAMQNPLLTRFAVACTTLGSTWVIAGVTVAVGIWLATRRAWAGLIYLLMTVPVGWFLGDVLAKNLIQRARPVGVALIELPKSYSLPSGHALASLLLYAAIVAIVMIETPPGRHVKRWVFGIAALAIVLVGWSRVYLGVHWAGDVLAAWFFGLAWWALMTAIYFGSVRMEAKRP